MKQDRWSAIDRARRLLGLTEKASRNEIREAYKKVCQLYHPDLAKGKDTEEKMARINASYRLLMDYADSYRINFLPNEDGMNGSEWWYSHFGQDPIWTSQGEED